MICLEDFLLSLPRPITVIGGSSLCEEQFPKAISINGFHPECSIAAINSSQSDWQRVKNFSTVIAPWPKRRMDKRVLVPSTSYARPIGLKKQPTTYFVLMLICQKIEIPVELYGVCGWATQHHHGDWEMQYMKHEMSLINVHDPRPRW